MSTDADDVVMGRMLADPRTEVGMQILAGPVGSTAITRRRTSRARSGAPDSRERHTGLRAVRSTLTRYGAGGNWSVMVPRAPSMVVTTSAAVASGSGAPPGSPGGGGS